MLVTLTHSFIIKKTGLITYYYNKCVYVQNTYELQKIINVLFKGIMSL